MGDVVFKGFQCLNSECQEFIFVRKDELGIEFEITCPTCQTVIRSGNETQFYEYELADLRDDTLIEEGTFTILHDDYVNDAFDNLWVHQSPTKEHRLTITKYGTV